MSGSDVVDNEAAFRIGCSAVNRLLSALNEAAGEPLVLDDDGTCALELGDDLPVAISVTPDGARVVIYAPIAPLPDDMAGRYAVCMRALQRNLIETALGDGTLGVDDEAGMLVFVLGGDIDYLDGADFADRLDLAAAAVMELRQELGFSSDSDVSEDAAPAPLVIKG